MTELFPYQVEGAAFLAKVGRGLLADEPGLGKTAQAIVACDRIGFADGPLRVVVICPASVVENWKREFDRFGVIQHDLSVVSYNKAGTITGGADVLILDEAHYLKSKDAKRTQAILGPKCDGVGGLVERAKHVFLLTGTPTPNSPDELWPLLRAVMPDSISSPIKNAPRTCSGYSATDVFDLQTQQVLRPLSYWSFVDRYCRTREDFLGHRKIVGGKNLGELKERIAPYIMRRKKVDVLKDLPPIRFDVLPLTGKLVLPADCTDELRELEKVLAEKGIDGLAAIAPHVAQLRRLTGLAKVAPVVEWVKEQLDGGLEKIVLFAHHKDVIAGLADGLQRLSIGTGSEHLSVLTGSSTPHERQYAIDEFQKVKTNRVFIGQIQAAGTGITLTAASDLVFVESSWVPAENEQAAMRIHRIGQQNACLVRFATLAGSIDEQIARACARKLETIRELFA